MSDAAILYDVTDNIATITLNRPDQLNSLDTGVIGQLIEAFDESDGNARVRAVIVTGAGRAFCAGQSLASADVFSKKTAVTWADLPPDDAIRDAGGRLTMRIFSSLKPIIAAVNGAAVGIGATMQLPMDFRIASESAKFGFVFARRGIVPEAASSWFLPRLVGIARALDWSMSGRVFTAHEALQAGLISAVHPSDQLHAAARSLAHELTRDTSPVSVALTRQLMWHGLTLNHPMQAHQIDSRLMAMRGASADAIEGVSSFLEKRSAHFADQVDRETLSFPWNAARPFS